MTDVKLQSFWNVDGIPCLCYLTLLPLLLFQFDKYPGKMEGLYRHPVSTTTDHAYTARAASSNLRVFMNVSFLTVLPTIPAAALSAQYPACDSSHRAFQLPARSVPAKGAKNFLDILHTFCEPVLTDEIRNGWWLLVVLFSAQEESGESSPPV